MGFKVDIDTTVWFLGVLFCFFVGFILLCFLITLFAFGFTVVYSKVAILVRRGISWFTVSQLNPNIWSGSSRCAELQVVTQSIHLLRVCFLQLASNPHCFGIHLKSSCIKGACHYSQLCNISRKYKRIIVKCELQMHVFY